MPATARDLAAPLAQISQQPRSAQYEPRRPENTLLHRVVRNHLASFLEQAAQVPEPGVPRFVDKELQAYLRCGVLALGFCRLQCGGCSYERLVPSSCKGRGFCPSCGGKRMTDLALHLTEHVIPYVPVRQFVLSIPHRLRYLRLRPCPLRRRAPHRGARPLWFYRRRAPTSTAVDRRTGAVTFLHPKGVCFAAQRFGSAGNLTPLPHPGAR